MGANIPDEFLTEVLKANSNDLTRTYEDLLQRLERKFYFYENILSRLHFRLSKPN